MTLGNKIFNERKKKGDTVDLSGGGTVLYGTDTDQSDTAGKNRKWDTFWEQRHVL